MMMMCGTWTEVVLPKSKSVSFG